MQKHINIIAIYPFLLVFYEIINYLGNDMYLPALPLIMTDLHTNARAAQLTLTSWLFGAAALQLFLGPISDKVGRRPVLLGSGLFFFIGTIVCGLASNIETLIFARFFQGLAVCAVVTAGYASIHELFESKKAIHTLAIMNSITVLAPAFGPLLGAIVLYWFNWREIFYLLAIAGAMALLLLWWLMPESNPSEKRYPLNWRSIAINYKNILKNWEFIAYTSIFCLTFLGMIAWITAGPFLVINTFHHSPFVFGIFQAIIFSTLIVGSYVVKILIYKLDARTLINIGLFIALISSIFAVLSTLFFPKFLLGLIISLAIFTFGSSLAFSTSQRIAIESCNEPMGARVAVFSTIMGLYGVIGALLVSLTYNGTLLWFGSLLLVVTVLAYLIKLKIG